MDINSYFSSFRNQFHKTALKKQWRENPYAPLIEKEAKDLSEGETPTIKTYTHELPTAYPASLSSVSISNGTGDPACKPSTTTIKRGEVHRTWSLAQTAFRTDTVCVSDLKRSHDAANAVSAMEAGLSEYTTVWWADYARVQSIKMSGFKVSTSHASNLDIVESAAADFTEVGALPTVELNWTILDAIYLELARSGYADELAIGRTESGQPVFPIVLSPYYIQKLFRDDTDKREQIKYFDPKSNLSVLGYQGAVNGFLPIVDLFPMRFGTASGDAIDAKAELTLANTIYPTVNSNATVGRKHAINPLWRKTGIGTGRAQFEVAQILPRNVFKMQYETVDPSSVSGMKFEPNDYLGEFQWINNKTFEGDNDLGNKGYYHAQIRVGAKPLFAEYGYSILTLAGNR